MKRTENLVVGGWLLGAVVLAGVLFLGTWAEAKIMSFEQFLLPSTVINPTQSLSMADNLMVRVGGVDLSVTAAGYGEGDWHLGLTNEEGFVVGWAKNSSPFPGRGDWLIGRYSGAIGDGGRPTFAFLVYDSTGNGWDIVGGQIGSEQDLLDGDLFFTEADILFGLAGLRGNTPEGIWLLPPYIAANGGVSAILPHMVVDPEPATFGLISPANNATRVSLDVLLDWQGGEGCTYNVYLGTDPNNLALISSGNLNATFEVNALDWATIYYWQVEKIPAEGETELSEVWSFETVNYICEEKLTGDLNGDCIVNLADLAMLSSHWLAESQKIPDNSGN